MKAQRVFAYLIDAIFIGVLSSVICMVTGLQIETLWTSGIGLRFVYNPVALLSLGVAVVYFLTDVMSGGSPGKKILGLMVSRNIPVPTGRQVEKDRFSTAITRSLVKVLSIHLIVGIILFLIGEDNSSLHDKLSGTRVQKKVVVA
ncbi:MAG TPA: RDD family protein [Saprospiraceae bacterium]|nr:RDD family protein [Saprospiraceae bacterium]